MKTYMEVLEAVNRQVRKGLNKYGKTVTQADLSPAEWIDNAVEEAIDQVFYLLALKKSLQKEIIVPVNRCDGCMYCRCSFPFAITNYCRGNDYVQFKPKEDK